MQIKNLVRSILCLFFVFNFAFVYAQDIHMRLQTRMSYSWDKAEHGNTSCDFLSLAIDGTQNEEFSYSAFQHFNRFDRVSKDDPLAATDWLYLKWRRKQVEVSAGKQMIEYGGEEYDAAPIDLYTSGVYWDNMASFSYALNLAYWLGENKVTFQVAEMPLADKKSDMAYSLSWRGKIGCYEPKHSLNMFGQGEGTAKLASFVLGNIFHVGPARMYLDFINRWNGKSVKLFKDFSVVASTTVGVTEWMDVRLKYNYDYNDNIIDMTCPMGTHQSGYLAAMELYPLKKNKDVRLHLLYRYKDCSSLCIGFAWRMSLV